LRRASSSSRLLCNCPDTTPKPGTIAARNQGETERPRPRLITWRPLIKSTLRGFATVRLPSGLKIFDCAVFVGRNGPWTALPATPQVDIDGRVKLDASGRPLYAPVLEWVSRDQQQRFSEIVIEPGPRGSPGRPRMRGNGQIETPSAARISPLRDADPELTRAPSYNPEAEQALLGALLISNTAHLRVSEFLQPEHFGNAVHARIYAAIRELVGLGQIANPVTLKPMFNQDDTLAEIGGAQYLARLAASAVTISNVEDYGRTIHDLYLRRQLIAVGEDLVNDAFHHDLERSGAAIADEAQARLAKLVTAAASNLWPEPADLLGVPLAPPFPIDFLPGALGDFVAGAARRMAAPVDFIAVPLIIAAGAAIGKDFTLAPKTIDLSWRERPCLWGACIASVGSKKTPAFNRALAPIWGLEAEFRQVHQDELKAYIAEARIAKIANKQWEKDYAAAIKNNDPAPDPPPETSAPTLRKIITNDATQERLVELMQQNPRGIMLYRDELSGWFHSFNQYRPGSDEQFLFAVPRRRLVGSRSQGRRFRGA
jgi:Protein of unknown function (DUF3987)/DnaB-like helicase N terminal domain